MLKDVRRKTSRAAILPFPGDPLLLNYWYKLFKEHWRDEIDKLYIYMNSTVEKDVVDYIRNIIDKDEKVVFIYVPIQTEHGDCINRCLDVVQEEYIMLVEDDAYIWTKGIVSQCFNQLECGSHDIVGSKRTSCSQEILDVAKKKWGLEYEGVGDNGPNFWPNFFFCKKELLLQTDRKFGANHWNPGEKIEALDHVCTTECAGDTFVHTSLQLRNLVEEKRISYVPQYHGHPEDIKHYEKREFLFDGKAPWCHIGSLSSGISGLIRDDKGRRLASRDFDPPVEGEITLPHAPNNEFEKMEYERRVQWWLKFYWSAPAIGLAEFRGQYKIGLDRIVQQFKLDRKRIQKRQQIYNQMISGDKRL